MAFVPFAQQSSDALYSGERILNYFLRPGNSAFPGVLIGRSGLEKVAEPADVTAAGGGRIRAMIEGNGVAYIAANGALYRLEGTKVTQIGLIADDVNTKMAVSGPQVAVVARGGYYVSDGLGVTPVVAGAITKATSVAFIDGYFIVSGTANGRDDAIQFSALDDGASFDALSVAFAENLPDPITDLVASHNQLWLVGARTIEIWYNAGAGLVPFVPNRGSIIERGGLTGTIATEDNGAFWVGEDRRVYRSQGVSPQVISTREIEKQIRTAGDLRGFMADDKGHKFYVLRRSDRPALAYDLTTGLWSEFSTGAAEGPWVATCSAYIDGVMHYGTETGLIARMSETAYTDLGDILKAQAVSLPIVRADHFKVRRVILEIETGTTDWLADWWAQVNAPYPTQGTSDVTELGARVVHEEGDDLAAGDIAGRGVTASAASSTATVETAPRHVAFTAPAGYPRQIDQNRPQVVLQVSKDGRNWGPEKWRPLGASGDYGLRARWSGLGAYRHFQVRVTITDPVARDIYGVSYD